MSTASKLKTAGDRLCDRVERLTFAPPVAFVYNPLLYAREIWHRYLERYADGRRRIVFLGMNPGPWGMAQTGVPFGEVAAVRDWMGLEGRVGKPAAEHPKRPIAGFDCPRSEVSGRRLWGLMAQRFGSPRRFFADQFVANYCPLVFMAQSARNITPDRLPASERHELFASCDEHLRTLLSELETEYVVGVGKFAFERAKAAVASLGGGPTVASILHPSPASPAANRGWAQQATAQLTALGLW